MLTPYRKLSSAYKQVEGLLDAGWSGEYGALAVAIGRSRRSGKVIVRLVRGYGERHPNWDHSRAYAKKTGQPAHLG
jgi:hypothetical protein